MFFLSTALYPLWKMEESGAQWIYFLTRFNPFTHAIEALRPDVLIVPERLF